MEKITVLTREASVNAAIKKFIRNGAKFILRFIKSGVVDFDIIKYCGHTAVTKSLIHGLKELGVNFNYNPLLSKNISETVVVLSDHEALAQAVKLKKKGIVKKILAGPNIVEISTKYDKILSAEEIDLIIVPSKMASEIYARTNPQLIGKIVIWYAGIDTAYWKPNKNSPKDEVLVYWKNATPAFSKEVELSLKRNGYKVNRIIYGHYSKKHFKKVLQKSIFSVFLSITETQGLALVESWSMNVPTLVWDPEIEHYYLRGIKTTSSPYLSEMTGVRWKELDEFEVMLKNINLYSNKFSPRKWVIDNMSDKVSAEMLVKIIKDKNR